LAAVHQLVLVRVLEQVHDRAHGADVEDRAAQDRRGDVDVQPVRVERRDQLVALGVEDGDGEPEVEQDGGGQEQADPAHVLLQREQREVDADRGGGERDVELVHVAPRRPLHGQRAGDHAAEREEEREHGEGDVDPAVEVALLVTAVGTGPVGHVARRGRGADGDLRPLQDGGAAALPHGDGGAALGLLRLRCDHGGGAGDLAATAEDPLGDVREEGQGVDRHRRVDEHVAHLGEALVGRGGRPGGGNGQVV